MSSKVEYGVAESGDANSVWKLVQQTIQSVYPKYYPKAVVSFFCQLHDFANISSDIDNGNIKILTADGRIVATGSRVGNHVARVFVAPDCMYNGYGSKMMSCLEDEIACEGYNCVCLETSIPAKQFYLNRGYMVCDIQRMLLSDSNQVFEYEAMKKIICKK